MILSKSDLVLMSAFALLGYLNQEVLLSFSVMKFLYVLHFFHNHIDVEVGYVGSNELWHVVYGFAANGDLGRTWNLLRNTIFSPLVGS